MPELFRDLPVMFFATQPDWHDWLAANHTQPQGIWLKIAKKAAGITSINYDQALEEALCYGWIDAQLQSYDASYYLQRFTPRRSKSVWSKRNVGIIERLSAEGRMQPAGQAVVDAAKADGRWDIAYAGAATMEMPDDFKAALAANPKAQTFYATLNKTNTYAILWRIHTAAKPATRQARIHKLIAMLHAGTKQH